MITKYRIPFLPVWCWKTPFGYPVYMLPIIYYPTTKKMKLYWGLSWFYFSCLWVKRGNLDRYRWFYHVYLNFITFLFLPYIVVNNYLNNNGNIHLEYVDYYPDRD